MKQTANQSIANAARAYPEIDNIKKDARALTEDTRDLAAHVYADGKQRLSGAADVAAEKLADLRVRGRKELGRAEEYVRANPGKSIAAAFVGGLIASLFLSRK